MIDRGEDIRKKFERRRISFWVEFESIYGVLFALVDASDFNACGGFDKCEGGVCKEKEDFPTVGWEICYPSTGVPNCSLLGRIAIL